MNNVIQLEDRVSCSRSKHEGESSAEICDRLSRTRVVVRGSSRRIMIMRFRPANISLINRRHYLPRLLLTLSSKYNNKNNPSDLQILTGHTISISKLHFRCEGRGAPIERRCYARAFSSSKCALSLRCFSPNMGKRIPSLPGLPSGMPGYICRNRCSSGHCPSRRPYR